jgi:threonylcarbamoyladenosine tRNA methylthiotransferase MtaB
MADGNHPLMPYLHVPLQSGCDSVLSRMKRKYQLKEMHDFFNRAKDAVSNICLGTDLLVGFPGETDGDFMKTCSTFQEFPLDYSHVFTFSERKGTPASKMDNQVPMDERRKRSAHLRTLSASKRFDFHKRQEGVLSQVLFENPKNNCITGYTENYTKVVIHGNHQNLSDKICEVELVTSTPEYIEGKLTSCI